MPFDATPMRDPLSELGITPVGMETLKAYKAKMLRGAPSLSEWLETPISVQNLASPDVVVPRLMPFWSAAPRRVIRLASMVQKAIPDAEFRLGHLRWDPYLLVKYETDVGSRTACLGIWRNRFWLVALAKRR